MFDRKFETIVCVTATYRNTLIKYLGGRTDLFDLENRSERLEGLEGVPLGMMVFHCGYAKEFEDNTLYPVEVRSFVQAIRAANELNYADSAEFRIYVPGEKHGFCVMTVPYDTCANAVFEGTPDTDFID